MRRLALVLLVACGKSEPAEPAVIAEGSGSAVVAATARSPAIVLDHVTLLHPEAVLATRVLDTDGLAGLLKRVGEEIASYDAGAATPLPAELDAVVAARKGHVRVWLVGPDGDLTIPPLAAKLAALPPVAIREGNVAAVITLVRTGTKAAKRSPYMPAAWKRAAGAGGADVDHVIDAVWPGN